MDPGAGWRQRGFGADADAHAGGTVGVGETWRADVAEDDADAFTVQFGLLDTAFEGDGTDLLGEDRGRNEFGTGLGQGETETDRGDGSEKNAERGEPRAGDAKDRGNAGKCGQTRPGP